MLVLALLAWSGPRPQPACAQDESGDAGAPDRAWTLEECIETALENNHQRPASAFAVAMAEAQSRQALAGYWPQVTLKGGWQLMDEAPNFIFPASNMYIPPQSFSVPGGSATVTIPADAFGPGFPPVEIEIPVEYPGQTVNMGGGLLPIREQNIKLMDRDSFLGAVDAKWLLFDGGMRGGWRQQARGNLDMKREESRRTDLEIVDSVKRLYYGAVLTGQLFDVGQETLERMEATLNLTETMYKEGSGRVMKTDFLANKVMVESLRSAVAMLEKNRIMARAALAYTMGLPWNESVRPADPEIAYAPLLADLDDLVSTAYRFSPDWKRLEAGVDAGEGMVKTAKSGYFPKIALTGEIHKWWNDYEAGMATETNKDGWSVGFGLELPVFDGFLTRNRVAEARAQLAQIQEQGFLLQEGIGLQVRDVFTNLAAAAKQYQATLDAMTSATENRDLNTRAYQNELVETEDVIQAQLIEALMKTQHYKMCYDHVVLLSKLDLVVGTEVRRQLESELDSGR